MSFVEKDLDIKSQKKEPGVIVFKTKAKKYKKKKVVKQNPVKKANVGKKKEKKIENNEDIIIDFDFFDSNESDFHCIKTFLTKLFSFDFSITVSPLVDLIVENNTTTIKTDGEEGDALAFITCLESTDSVVKEVVEKILKTHNSASKFVGKSMGLLINERLINMPNEVSLPLFKFLFETIPKHSHFLYITTNYRFVSSKVENDEAVGNIGEWMFYKDEDEILKDYSEEFWEFPCSNQDSDSKRAFQEDGVEVGRTVMILKASELKKFFNSLQSMITINQ